MGGAFLMGLGGFISVTDKRYRQRAVEKNPNQVLRVRRHESVDCLVTTAIFAVLVGFFFQGLTLDPSAQPSALIGKPVPSFQLTELHTGQALTSRTLPAEPFLLNVWASWCITCK